jgi:2-iminobutanoate/2-iminopropanoate deaminase
MRASIFWLFLTWVPGLVALCSGQALGAENTGGRGMAGMGIVQTDQAPLAIGPYSQAVWAGDLLFLSGQIPLDPATGQVVPGGIEAQTRQVIRNAEAVLKAAGLSLAHVVKATVFVKDLNQFAALNAVYGSFFPAPAPARSTVEAARLPRDVLVEIEFVARR